MPNNFVLISDYLHTLTLRFETTVCNNAKPGKRIVRTAIEKCGTSNRAINCVNAIYGVSSKTWNDLKPPKTTYNHLQPPQKFQQRPTTTSKTSTATRKLSKTI